MAVLANISTQMTPDVRLRPLDQHGKIRIDFFDVPAANTPVIGDANTTFELCILPPGAVRVLPNMSRVSMSAQGAARTLSIGHRSYAKRPPDNANEAENDSAFVNAMDVSGAVSAAAFSTVLKYDLYSLAGVTVFARVKGGTTPVGTTLSGYIAYVYE